MSKKVKREGFSRELEGMNLLDELLALSGARVDADGAAELFGAAQAEGAPSSEVIPQLFEEEPRFPDPDLARRLYQNLLGLWDLVAAGQKVFAREEQTGPKRPPKPPKPVEPEPFGTEGPDQAFVDTAWKFIQDDERSRARLLDAFENRQDALLQYLEEQNLSEIGYASARYLLFELFAFLELGWPSGVRSVDPSVQQDEGTDEIPPALRAYVEEALTEAELDEEEPLTGDELVKVRRVVERGLRALWDGRKPALR